MNPSKTINVVSTPNIEGNIGSCTVQSNEVKVYNNLLRTDYKVVQINSCTGQIIGENIYSSYENGIGLLGATAFVLLALAIIGLFCGRPHSY